MKKVDTYIFRGPHIDVGALDIQGKISSTLDLESGKQVFGDKSPLNEALLGEAHGIKVYSHPLGALFPPSVSELREAAEFLEAHNSLRINTYVHCHKGVDRTGMVIAAYRILKQGWSSLHAIDEMLDEGFHWAYFFWIPQLWRI